MRHYLIGYSALSRRRPGLLAVPCFALLLSAVPCLAQVDQGTITGTITDPSGAVVPNAQVTLTDTNTGLVLKAPSNGAGVYVFSPIKIGSYQVSVSASGFSGSALSGLTLNVNQRLEADVKLVPGNVSQTVSVRAGAAQLLETEQSSVGQTMSAKVINETPLNGRNYVFIAQLAAGVVQSAGSRGEGNGDFSANGLRAEQNNFILDGVDNNSNEVDFLNGASYNVKPPPDALAEFKVQTSDYDAQFGHSAGAVINASIKSGTNALHGDLWEYWRNDALDAQDYFAVSKGEYRQHQFGGTIGGPILKNRLFFFGDVEATRIIYGAPGTYSVPTALMRQGNFSEYLNTSLTDAAEPTVLYEPGTKGNTQMVCNGQENVLCANQINPVAQRILNLYPLANANNGKTYNNYLFNVNYANNTVAWDGRIDWNASAKDQAFFRMSYYNLRGNYAPPLGNILDGGGYGADGPTVNMGENYVLSETHIFSPTLANEFRFGYNWNHPQFLQPGANTDVAAEVGLGGIPYGPNNGGLPSTSVSGISSFGSPGFYPAIEYENVFQILDNVTKSLGNHTLKFGVSFQNVRVSTTAPINPHGSYDYSGFYTSSPGVSFTGAGEADFLTDEMASASLSNLFNIENVHWYDSAYFQDDWKVLPKLTLNMGLRYDYFQPAEERHDNQAYFYPTSVTGPAQGTAEYLLPKSATNLALAPSFTALLSKDHINLGYSGNRSLALSQKLNFSPRVGFAFHPNERTVVRAGYGIFFGGLESTGGAPNPGYNYPFSFSTNFPQPACGATTCATDGISLNTGFANAIAAGLQNFISVPGLVGGQLQTKTPYTEQYNLSTQYALTPSLSFTLAYVGNESKHIQATYDANAPYGVVGPADSSQNDRPFPDFGGVQYADYEGVGMYNSLQATMEKHTSHGLYFLAAYTWAHAMDDTATPLNGGTNDYRNATLFPVNFEYANSDWDVRNRFTFNGDYELPFGRGRHFMNHGGITNEIAGGWSTDLVFFAVGGSPFTVSPNISTVNGSGARAILVKAPYAAGGAPDPSNPSIACAGSTRNLNNWYNPCAFANPLPGNLIPDTQTAANPVGDPVTSIPAILPFVGTARNQLYGPGYERINMSLFKNFTTFESQYLQVRADIFNLFNTPAFGQPNGGINGNGGQITGTRSLGAFTPNSRFFQLAAKYYF